MKKTLAILMACMMLLSTLLLASCKEDAQTTLPPTTPNQNSGITENDAKNDPFTVLTNALNKATASFGKDVAGINPVLNNALNNGSVAVHLVVKGMDIDAVIYSDAKNGAFAINVLVGPEYVKDPAQKTSFTVRLDKSSVGVQIGESAYVLNYTKFESEFKNSTLYKSLVNQLPEEELKNLEKQIFAALSAVNFEETALPALEEITKKGNEYLSLLDKKLNITDLTVGDKTEKCVELAYTVNKDSFMKLVNQILDKELFKDATAEQKELAAQLKLQLAGVLADIQFEGTIHSYVSMLKGELRSVKAEVKVTDPDNIVTEVKGSLAFNDSTISLKGTVLSNGTVVASATAELTKKEDNKSASLTLKFHVDADTEMYIAELTASYNKETGAFLLEMKANPDTAEPKMETMLKVEGTLKKETTSFVFSIDSIVSNGEKVEFAFSVSVKTGGSVPTITNAKNVLDMTYEELQTIIGALIPQQNF